MFIYTVNKLLLNWLTNSFSIAHPESQKSSCQGRYFQPFVRTPVTEGVRLGGFGRCSIVERHLGSASASCCFVHELADRPIQPAS